MSRVGSNPVEIPTGVEVKIEEKSNLGGLKIIVKGPLGELTRHMRKGITAKVENNTLIFGRSSEAKKVKSLHGLYRSLVENMIEGVTKGYKKNLEMVGIGYKSEVKGADLELTVGSTHPHIIKAPEGITFEVKEKVNISVKGIDKQLVGQVAAKIREQEKPEPYKGKGIRYKGEYVRRKAGKAAKSAEGAE